MTVPEFVDACQSYTPTVMITAYDMTSAMIAEAGGVDAILVGDSLASVIRGEPDTRNVSVDEMIYHTKIVVRHTQRPLIIADMPYGDFQCSAEEACRAAIRIWKETGCGAIKVEGGVSVASHVEAMVRKCEIPVMGHVGLRPQAAGIMGGFKAQGRSNEEKTKIENDAHAMQNAGCFAIVLRALISA
jgi:3-methyl-2-oxobutanoate hydroxymethyltransferase